MNYKINKRTALLAMAYILPFILYSTMYQDDIGRSIWGYYDWESNGRPLATLIMKIFNMFENSFNLSPLYLLTGMYVYIFVFENSFSNLFEENKTILAISCLLFLGCPFFLENLSYNFDSMTMLFSISLALYSIFIIKKKRIINEIIVKSIAFVLMLSLYQATFNLCISLIIIYCISSTKIKVVDNIKRVLINLISLALGYVCYYQFIAKKFLKLDYNIIHSQTNFDYKNIINNYNNFFKIINPIITTPSTSVIIAFSLLIIIISTIILLVNYSKKKNNILCKSIILLTVILSPLLTINLCVGSLVFLQSPIYSPRVLIGSMGYMLLFAYSAYNISSFFKKRDFLFTIISLPLSIMAFNFSYTYNRALQDQGEFENYIVNSVSNELFQTNFSSKTDTLIILGKEPRTMVSQNAILRIPYLENTLPRYFYGNNPFGFILLKKDIFLKDLNIPNNAIIEKAMNDYKSSSVVYKSYYYSIFKTDKTYYLSFN